jgi:hypothetical protein
MITKHYNIQKLSDYPCYEVRFKRYLNDIEEKAYPLIEEVFGGKCEFDHITVVLNDSGDWSYPGNGVCNIDVTDEVIQARDLPRNLWGCVLHETLHAFMQPIIHRGGGANCLDKDYCDKNEGEPFIFSFQHLVYLKMRDNRMLDDNVYEEFSSQLINKLKGEGAKELYQHYLKFFSSGPNYFARFVQVLNSSEEPLIKKKTFWDDLKRLEMEVGKQEAGQNTESKTWHGSS